MKQHGIVLLDKQEFRSLTERLCADRGLPIALLEELVFLEHEFLGRLRRRGMTERIEEILQTHLPEEESSCT